jgi:hypothetical protein
MAGLEGSLSPGEMDLISILKCYPGLRRTELPPNSRSALPTAIARGLVVMDDGGIVTLTEAGRQADDIIEEQLE